MKDSSTIDEYLSKTDWRVNANANQGYSLGGLILNSAGKLIANYWLREVYSADIDRSHRNADFHIHDLDFLSGYCAGWSLRMLLEEGFGGVPGRVEAAPANHLESAVGQIVNFLGTLQNEWAGAQAFSSFDTYLAPFIRKDLLLYDEVKQCIQSLIYNLNVPSRWGSQAPFTNLTFDWICPDDLKNKNPIIGGVVQNFTYGELQIEMDFINRAFIEVMLKGDHKGRVFAFPIPTYNITPDFPWDSDNAKLLMELTVKYGLPYFQNFINSDLQPNMVRSMCCRLQLDVSELLKRGNGLFGSAEQTGSLGVVTINCARLGFLYASDETKLFQSLDRLLELAKQSLEIKRTYITELLNSGLLPYSQRYLSTFRNHFSTIGVNGMNEMVRNFTGGEFCIADKFGQDFAIKFLDRIRLKLVEFQKQTGHMYNLEATPAEGASFRFAKEDRARWPEILQGGTNDAPYYTNSSQLPPEYSNDVFDSLTKQEVLQGKYTGGTVFHIFLGERMQSTRNCAKLIQRALTNFKIPYLTISPTFSICPKHGYLDGEHEYCPKCDEELIINGTKDT